MKPCEAIPVHQFASKLGIASAQRSRFAMTLLYSCHCERFLWNNLRCGDYNRL